jgi:DNA-binding transcriptional ArsR family regulator
MAKQSKIEAFKLNGTKEEIHVVYPELKKMVLITRALEHDLRRKMINLLSDQNKMTVTEVYLKMKIEQSVASQHLAILRRAGVVSSVRDGKFIFYNLNKNQLEKIASFVSDAAE